MLPTFAALAMKSLSLSAGFIPLLGKNSKGIPISLVD